MALAGTTKGRGSQTPKGHRGPKVQEKKAVIDNLSTAHSLRKSPEAEHRPPIPATPEGARAAEPWFSQRAIAAYRRFEAAKREFLNCRGELAVVQAVAKGEYEPDPELLTHATGSSGAWPVVRQYREVSLDDWAVRA